MNLSKYIDHTILKADTIKEAVIKVCSEAKEYGFYSVCVNPYFVSLVKEELEGSEVKITSVIGFPLGASVTDTKVYEARKAVDDGADEIDMVINVSALKDADYDYVENDIRSVKSAIGEDKILKVIIETSLLTDDEKIAACKIADQAGADFVKTSTGFSTGGATVEDVKLMKSSVSDRVRVKASGGIRSFEIANSMIEAGASRLGASASVAIIQGKISNSEY